MKLIHFMILLLLKMSLFKRIHKKSTSRSIDLVVKWQEWLTKFEEIKKNCIYSNKHFLMAFACKLNSWKQCEFIGNFQSGWDTNLKKNCHIVAYEFFAACSVFDYGRNNNYCNVDFSDWIPDKTDLSRSKTYYTDGINANSFHTERVAWFYYENNWAATYPYIFLLGIEPPCTGGTSNCDAFLDKVAGSNYCYFSTSTQLYYSNSVYGGKSC